MLPSVVESHIWKSPWPPKVTCCSLRKLIKPIINSLFCCFTNTCVLPAVCRFIRERSSCISVFLRQAHHNLHGIITVHPSSFFTLQLEKAQELCEISCSAITETFSWWVPHLSIHCSVCHKPPLPCSQWDEAQSAPQTPVAAVQRACAPSGTF